MAKKKRKDEIDSYGLFKQQLKNGEYRPIYAFFGEESYLTDNYRRELKKRLVDGPAEDFNYHRFTEENWNVEALAEAVDAIPMMSEYSFIEIVDMNLFSMDESTRNALAEIFSSMPEYCVILLVYDAVPWKPDKRMKKLWGSISDKLLEVEFEKQSEAQLIPWIRRHLATAKKVMSDELCRYLIMQTGGSMTTMAAELQKLMSYTDQAEITRKDIDDVVIPVVEAEVYKITKDIGGKNFDEALQRLRDLVRQDVDPIMINATIGRQMRQMYVAKVLQENKKGPYELKELCDIRWESQAKELYNQSAGFRKQLLRRAALLSAETDYAMKRSAGDKQELLELMILKLAKACMGGR